MPLGDLGSVFVVESSDAEMDQTLRALHAPRIANPILRFHDGTAALEAMRGASPPPALLLLNRVQKVDDGLQLLIRMKRDALLQTIPVFFLSESSDENDVVRTCNLGVETYVWKPVGEGELVEAAAEFVTYRENEAISAETIAGLEILDSVQTMIWVADATKAWRYCNRAWVEFTGQSVEQSLGAGWASLLHPDDLARTLQAYDAAFEAGTPLAIEHRLLRHDGEYRWVSTRGVSTRAGFQSETGITGSCTDITDLRQMDERLRHSSKLEGLGMLAGGIAHDFNNLLTGILGNASLALLDLPPDHRVSRYIDNIVQASETAARLTRQMLEYSGKGRFVLECIDLSKEVGAILALLEASIAKSVTLELNLGTALPAVEADPSQIQQLVMNLAINASEAVDQSGPGRVMVSTSIEFVGETAIAGMLTNFKTSPGPCAVLRVRDNGEGMDAVTKARIFDPFFTTKFGGRGLGLAAVSGIVRGHKAGLALETAPGRGTEFRIYFPVGNPDPNIAPVGEPERLFQGSGTVLVVDDSPAVRRLARLALERHGYAVLVATDGTEGVERFRALADEIDLVLLDMTMPAMPGDQVFHVIRTLREDVPVIASSGYNQAEAGARFGAGIDGFLQKPYRAAELAEAVYRVLERRPIAGVDFDE